MHYRERRPLLRTGGRICPGDCKDDESAWEEEPLEKLAQQGQLHTFKHEGFWQPMDTLRDKNLLERLWQAGDAPWKIW